jgi:hypothetical protein
MCALKPLLLCDMGTLHYCVIAPNHMAVLVYSCAQCGMLWWCSDAAAWMSLACQ